MMIVAINVQDGISTKPGGLSIRQQVQLQKKKRSMLMTLVDPKFSSGRLRLIQIWSMSTMWCSLIHLVPVSILIQVVGWSSTLVLTMTTGSMLPVPSPQAIKWMVTKTKYRWERSQPPSKLICGLIPPLQVSKPQILGRIQSLLQASKAVPVLQRKQTAQLLGVTAVVAPAKLDRSR